MPKINFVNRDGSRTEVEAEVGKSVMEVAMDNEIDIESACEGSLACATCHLVVDPDWFGKIEPAGEDETDMLDLAFGLTPTSRLSCQISVTDDMDGITFSVPEDI
ncbi:2Fe-2S iron-sulfur cluster-binding protein [Aestuariispira insulae]|uniref:2Fe-2S ferredoxin n=1 Tax=Aestuariispira insulae TaxID=1461337 RepID=A0A3D9HVX2_9PROT|nr:2Fe-2S iron-sulfur cluster-binding protein [Aestuariispira insulae]RED53642.1 2Fe-2S ferredoxin [Aestuariispira insulae]